jgi:hypothetical protein
MSFLFGVIAASYDNTVPPPPPPPPPPPVCTPVCGEWSYTYGEWSAYSECVNNVQTRSRTVNGSRTCQASDCSIYTETTSYTETESQACSSPPPTETWYCSVSAFFYGQYRYTSTTDNSGNVPCDEATSCSTSGYPDYPLIPC